VADMGLIAKVFFDEKISREKIAHFVPMTIFSIVLMV